MKYLAALLLCVPLGLLAQEPTETFNPPPGAQLPNTYYAQILFQDSGLVQWGISNLGTADRGFDGGELWIQRKNPQEQYRYATLQAVGYFPQRVVDWFQNSAFHCVDYNTLYNFTYAKNRGWISCLQGGPQDIPIVYINPADPVEQSVAQMYYTQYGAGQ